MKTLTNPYIDIGKGARQNRRFACILTSAVYTYLPLIGRTAIFRSGDKVFARLSEEGRLEIMQDYACDGYSPTIRFFGKWLGTPAPNGAGLFPAVFHDFTRQFCKVDGCPWTREDSDKWFYDLMIDAKVNKHIAGVYYGAVSRLAGSLWHKFSKLDLNLSIKTQ
jgi:hypothetical protein